MKNRPVYGIDSVDHALKLVLLLQQEGPVRVADAAERLGVARSTAHRLLSMLVYRDFAEQGSDRRYQAGPALGHAVAPEPVDELRRVFLPHLQRLAGALDETTHAMVVIGDQARFIASVECGQMLRVGDREGRVLPAHITSGGRAVLAARPEAEIVDLYSSADSPVDDVPRLLRDLRRIRLQGFAVNLQATERGVAAIGCRIPAPVGTLSAAISVAMPISRYRRELLPEWYARLAQTAARISADLYGSTGRRLAVLPRPSLMQSPA